MDLHPDINWRQVYPGQDWKMPDGEILHVSAISWDGMERSAFLIGPDGGVTLMPAASLVRMAERVFEKSS
jgi:hypothetical protein